MENMENFYQKVQVKMKSCGLYKGLILLILLIFGLFFYFNVGQFLTLESLKQYQADLQQIVIDNYWFSWAFIFIIYIIITAISIPGATIFTLAIGATFGFWSGLVLVSFASTIGATLAFLLTRFLFRNWIFDKFSTQLKIINQGLKTNGTLYLFSLRLTPILPFFLINIAFGLTKIKVWQFYWVSQAGMLIGTAVYVNAGTQLGSIKSSTDIILSELILSFILLGLFPFFAKKILQKIKTNRGYRPFKNQ